MVSKYYSEEVRVQAVQLYVSTPGATIRGIAEDLDIALVLAAALAYVAERNLRSSDGPLGALNPQLMAGGKGGYLWIVALAGLHFSWQPASGLWKDSGRGMAVALGIGVVLSTCCWAVLHGIRRSEARAVGNGLGIREIVGSAEPRVDPLFQDTDCLRICALLLHFQDLRASSLQPILDMDDDRFQAALTHLKSRLMVSNEPPVGRSKHADADDWLHLTFQGESAIIHQLAAMESSGSSDGAEAA